MYSSFVRRLTSGVMLVTGMLGTAAYAQTEDASEPRRLFVEGEVTCGTKCPRLNHFQFGLRTFLSERLSLQLAWDPGLVEKPTWEDTYDRLDQRLPPRRTWFDRYALRFRASDAVEVSLENWNAATLIPDASGLSFAHALQDSGWNQTALRMSVIDTERPANSWTLIAGLGEGERFKDRDHKAYLALMLRREISEGLEWQGAYSMDPDSMEEESFYWLPRDQRAKAREGFKNERQALSLILTGQHRKARGLRAAIGLQKNLIRGPKTPADVTAVDPSEGPFDLTEILAEHWGMRSEIEKRTLAFSASYLILAEYLLAFHHQDLDVKLRAGARARACQGLGRDGRCLDAGTDHDRLRLREDTFGIGYINESGFSLFLENFFVKYDRLYELYHFAPGQDKRQRAQSFAQVRLTWNW
ncbi:MAG TPA: hypothetical protein VFO10_29355 [Oligoflexus sp.]|uniref:hypothetical protein n=1 Tax=Oligoflexus sp. TaxID=1971216 RepID=UPI002D7E5F7F|nr:hypothetical protein [Oligoflexus sp.]HET9241410.1 hypothetical protein [Oligoflexus sp.]